MRTSDSRCKAGKAESSSRHGGGELHGEDCGFGMDSYLGGAETGWFVY
jgi:hypothetical protein